MKTVCSLLLALCVTSAALADPIRLHPENPRYFEYEGEPTVLITSAEHYGALVNLDFDYEIYFEELERTGMNLTRVFSGVYCEPVGAFNIEHNTLAPRWNRFIAPFARSNQAGYPNGGNKFDLDRWDPDYFKRLKDFMREADRHDVIVEYVLFCPFYRDDMWDLSPMNAQNNVNGYSNVERTDAYALKDDRLTALQKRFTKQAAIELNRFDNFYFEICNEPYFGGVTMEWQAEIAQALVDAEAELPKKHLIAQNIANNSKEVEAPLKHIDIYNYHYAFPPEAVYQNLKLNKPIGYDESGFKGESDTTYRSHAWAFMMAGGAVFNNLDYSFTADYEDGTAKVKAPGGGSAALRSQLQVLAEFMNDLDFIEMQPSQQTILKTHGDPRPKAWCLAKPGETYAIYIIGDQFAEIELSLPKGDYEAEWISVHTGEAVKEDEFAHPGGPAMLQSPRFQDDIALKLSVD